MTRRAIGAVDRRFSAGRSSRGVVLRLLFGAVLFIIGPSFAVAEATAHGSVIKEYPIASDGDLIVIPVNLAGQTFHFMLDTGSSCTVCDSSLALKLGPVEGTAEVNGGPSPVASCREAFVANWQLPTQVILLDLGLIRKVSGFDVRGVLGMDFLADKILRIDYDAGKLQFLWSVDSTGCCEVKLNRRGNGWLMVEAEIHRGIPEWFLFDTGDIGLGFDGMLRPGLRAQLLANGAAQTSARALSVTATGKHRDAGSAQISALSLGGFRHEKLTFTDSEEVSALGSEYWLRYVVTLDIAQSRMFLRPSNRFARHTSTDKSGIHFLRMGQQNTIMRVDEASPAASADVRPDDVLINIGELDGSEVTPRTLRLALCNGSGPLPIVVERDGKRLSKVLRLPRF